MKKKEEIIKKLSAEKAELEKIIQEAEERMQNAPAGTLHTVKNRGAIRYYNRTNTKDTNGIYIPKSKEETVNALLQKKYDQQLISIAKEQYKLINSFLSKYDAQALENIYSFTNIDDRGRITPAVLSDEEYIKQWESKEYNRKEFEIGAPEHYTRKNERVRSKSEVMIGNELYDAGVPYLYEYPYWTGDECLHPDFSCLRIRDRRVIRWEHLGLMDIGTYRNDAIDRIRKYEKKGVILGKNLIITMETAERPLTIKDIRAIIQANFF